MQKAPRPAKAATTPQWYKDHLDRIQDTAENAICAVATDLGPHMGLRLSTDDSVAQMTYAIRVFNTHAERLDKLYGFPTRLKVSSTGYRRPKNTQDVSAVRQSANPVWQPGVAFTVAPKRPAFRSHRLRGGRPAIVHRGSVNWLRKHFSEREMLAMFGGKEANRNENNWAAEAVVFPRDMDMLTRMETGRFKVFKHLNDWFQEFSMYHRKDGKVVKEGDDLMAATRYAVMSLRFASTKAQYDKFRRPIKYPKFSVA